jgi:hypothetical protein
MAIKRPVTMPLFALYDNPRFGAEDSWGFCFELVIDWVTGGVGFFCGNAFPQNAQNGTLSLFCFPQKGQNIISSPILISNRGQ